MILRPKLSSAWIFPAQDQADLTRVVFNFNRFRTCRLSDVKSSESEMGVQNHSTTQDIITHATTDEANNYRRSMLFNRCGRCRRRAVRLLSAVVLVSGLKYMRNVNVCCCDDAVVGDLERRIDKLDNSLDTVASSKN